MQEEVTALAMLNCTHFMQKNSGCGVNNLNFTVEIIVKEIKKSTIHGNERDHGKVSIATAVMYHT